MSVNNYYFMPNVKTEKSEFFDREDEIELIEKSIKTSPLIVIYGLRRMGKTSLLNVALNYKNLFYIIIDARELYNEKLKISENDFFYALLREFSKKAGKIKQFKYALKDIISNISGVSIKGVDINFDIKHKRFRITDLLYEIDKYAHKKNKKFIIGIDEAQYLRFSNSHFDILFASFIDRFKNIGFILTGSEIGLLEKFLDIDNPDKPLFGRVYVKVLLDKFDDKKSREFLVNGFKQLDIKIDKKNLDDAIELFNGNAGWLTMYGYYTGLLKYNTDAAMEEVINYATKLELSELNSAIMYSKERYLSILKAIAMEYKQWKKIKDYTMVNGNEYIDDKIFNRLLNRLIDYGFVYRNSDGYYLVDNILKIAINSLK